MKKLLLSLLSIFIISNVQILTSYAGESQSNTQVNSDLKTPQTQVKSIAILDFENNTGLNTQDNLKKALSDTLTTNLSKYQGLTIVERTRLKDAIEELKLGQTGFISQDTAIKIGKTAGSQYIILGSVSKIGQTFELSTRLVDIESSKIISANSIRCYEDEMLLKSIDYLSMEVANSLGQEVSRNALNNLKNDIENYKKGGLNWLVWAGVGALVIGGGVGGYYWYTNSKKPKIICNPPNCIQGIDKPIIKQPIANQPIAPLNYTFSAGLNGISLNFDF